MKLLFLSLLYFLSSSLNLMESEGRERERERKKMTILLSKYHWLTTEYHLNGCQFFLWIEKLKTRSFELWIRTSDLMMRNREEKERNRTRERKKQDKRKRERESENWHQLQGSCFKNPRQHSGTFRWELNCLLLNFHFLSFSIFHFLSLLPHSRSLFLSFFLSRKRREKG